MRKGKHLCEIYLVDSRHTLVESMKDRFRNNLKYTLKIFSSSEPLIEELKKQSFQIKRTRILVYVLRPGTSIDEVEFEMLDIIKEIKDINSDINLIIVADNLESEASRKLSASPAFTFFQNNDNALLKITNHVMGLISKDNLERKYLSLRQSVFIFVIFILTVLFLSLALYFLMPRYF